MVLISGQQRLPTAEELPHSDDTPVDNELQNYIPNLLLNLLLSIWGDRQDWFFGVDMAIHYEPHKPHIVPDGFLAIGVPRNTGDRGRLSFVTWQEKNTIPILMLEVVSEKYNGEYEKKLQDYERIGSLYYVIYNPLAGKQKRFKHRQPLEVYKLVNQKYQLLDGNPVWLPEIGLAIGYENRDYANWSREWLFWYDQSGARYLTEREKIAVAESATIAMWQAKEQERQAKERERLAKEKLANYLRAMGINPEDI
jgi:Uma2 family endonuclease